MRKKPEVPVKMKCEYCNSSILVHVFRLNKYSHFYCNRECRGLAQRNGKVVYCDYCGDIIILRPSEMIYEKNFCNGKCYGSWRSENLCGPNNSRWTGKVKVNCAWCGTSMRVYPCFSEQHNFCDDRCESFWRSERYSGIDNPNWQGGLSFTPYGIGFTKTLRSIIKERDNYTCQYCGKIDVELAVHHIDYDKEHNQEDNLISLCSGFCHSLTNFNREYWTRLFQRKIREGATTIPSGSTVQANGTGSARHPILQRRMMI